MRYDEALALLGLRADHDADSLRSAYREAARRLHPDRPGAPLDATERMAAVNHAYAILNGTEVAEPAGPGSGSGGTGSGAGGRRGAGDRHGDRTGAGATSAGWTATGARHIAEPVAVELFDDGSLLVDAPAEETFDALVEAMELVGDLTYVDAEAGLVQVLVRPGGGPFCYLTCSLQGRALGTEVFTTVERLDVADAPHAGDVAAVLRQLADTLGGG